ncbi:putative mitochondrial protein AtMg00860 [Bidens hawaiensis]|uniref:putative mitochondrial protein AtMg00860 n=1 Tax=Bidens hawaiensis TaxID=980011 RepID=UPI004048EC7F
MKLNSAKCSFGMEEGKSLGVIVTDAGFKANPDKVQAIARMPSPSSLKEVQTLNGRLVALNRFLANHAAKSHPFISTLRNCLKKAQFKWTAEAEKAFLEVKKCLMELPTLTAPHVGEP